MLFRISRAICVPIAFFLTCLSLHAVDGDVRPQVMISSRFFSVDGTDVLSAPRITTLSGQQATIRIGQESDAGDQLIQFARYGPMQTGLPHNRLAHSAPHNMWCNAAAGGFNFR